MKKILNLILEKLSKIKEKIKEFKIYLAVLLLLVITVFSIIYMKNKNVDKDKEKNQTITKISEEEKERIKLEKQAEKEKEIEEEKKKEEQRAKWKNETINEIATLKEYEEKIINSNEVALVEFYANWCNPCIDMKPILKELVDEKYNIYTINAENTEFEEMIKSENIVYLPTIKIVKGSKILKTMSGAYTKEELKKILDEYKGE